MHQKKTMTILIASFVFVVVLLCSILCYQFVHIYQLKQEQDRLQDRIESMQDQIEDMESQIPQA